MSPNRIQLKRTKGWRKPEGAIVVSRPSRWGNPFKVGESMDRTDPCFTYLSQTLPTSPLYDGAINMASLTPLTPEVVVEAYWNYLLDTPALWLAARDELRGHDLACWCDLASPCHADVLLNAVEP